MRSFLYSVFLLLALVTAAAAMDEEDRALLPDETDFALINTCLDQTEHKQYPDTSHCIRLVSNRCIGLRLHILPMQCDEREKNAWHSLMDKYFDLIIRTESSHPELVASFVYAHENWLKYKYDDCSYLTGRWADGTTAQKEASYACSLDAYAVRALKYYYLAQFSHLPRE